MKLLKIIIRNEKFEEVKESLTAMHVTGMTVTEVRGHGRQKGHKAVYRGTEYSVTLLPKIMIEVIIPDEMVAETMIVGDRDEVRDGVRRWEDAGVTMLLVACRNADHVRSLADVVLG